MEYAWLVSDFLSCDVRKDDGKYEQIVYWQKSHVWYWGCWEGTRGDKG